MSKRTKLVVTGNVVTKATKRAAAMSITEITVAGFKSINDEQTIDIRPLTILAGANSSGKSSIMQPVLLLKQTLEAPYAPGPLLLNGPNVKFSSAEQLLSRVGPGQSLDSFQVGMRAQSGDQFRTTFRKEHKTRFRIENMDVSGHFGQFSVWPGMTEAEIIQAGMTGQEKDHSTEAPPGYGPGKWEVMED